LRGLHQDQARDQANFADEIIMLVLCRVGKRVPIRASIGRGSLLASAAVIVGVGGPTFVGTGALHPQNSTVSGAGVSGSTGTGALAAQAAVVDGDGTALPVPSGALQAQNSTVSGAGTSKSSGSGALQAQNSTVSGAGTSKSSGSGALASQNATLSGSGSVPNFTTWNSADKNSDTLSNGNLTATASAGGDHGVRAKGVKYSGKWFWEITTGGTWQTNAAFGVASPGALLATTTDRRPSGAIGSTAQLACLLFKTGNVFTNGSVVSAVNGTTINQTTAFALDLDNNKMAFKVGSNNWNNNVANDPATGAFDIAAIAKLGLYPVFSHSTSGDVCTGNFGSSSFVNTVPTGYNAGWSDDSATALYIDPASIVADEVRSSASSKAVTMTTQGASDIIIVVGTELGSSANVVSTVSGSTLGSFTRRKTHHTKPGTIDMVIETWYKHSTGALSGETITVTLAGTNDKLTVIGFAVANANASIWDGNASLPAVSQNSGSTKRTVGSVSTTNANSLVLGFSMSPDSPDTFASGFATGLTGLQGFYNHTSGTNWCDLNVFGKKVSATQSGITVETGTISSEQWVIIADAIYQ
jgi:hypothetical protein